jgi:hypothetical protein
MRLLKILFVFSLAILFTVVAFHSGKLNSSASPFGILTADGDHHVPNLWLTAEGVRPLPKPYSSLALGEYGEPSVLMAEGVRPLPGAYGHSALGAYSEPSVLMAEGVRPLPGRYGSFA